MKSLQEGLGGIRDVLLSGSQKIYVNIFKKSEIPFRRATARITIVSMSPRYAIESLGMILIAIMAYTLADRAEGISSAIPILGAFALEHSVFFLFFNKLMVDGKLLEAAKLNLKMLLNY